jgi:PEP-CTERM motif
MLVVALGCAASVPAAAGSLVVSGSTSGQPTYNRVLDGFPVLAEFGAAVPFQAVRFTVSLPGEYALTVTALAKSYDPFLTLYEGAFSAADPVANWRESNDDLDDGAIGQSGFQLPLSAGTEYIAVTAGFSNDDAGPYTLAIAGPGDVRTTAVPEPATIGLAVTGLALLGAWRRRAHAPRRLS